MSKFIAGAIGAIWTIGCLVVGFVIGGMIVFEMKINEKTTNKEDYING